MKSLNIGNLSIKRPIIQGGMGVGISLSKLASSVANEGGVGVISAAGIGLLYPNKEKSYFQNCKEGLKQEIIKARSLCKKDGIIGVNVMVALSNYKEMVKTAIKEKADIIFSGAGLPLDLPSFITKESQTKLVPIVSSGRAAMLLCKKWLANFDYIPDAFVVEGPKAGGHLGFKKDQIDKPEFQLENIIPEVVEIAREWGKKNNKYIPVIAAGGIYTGKDVYDFINLGADGVQLGTRFVTTYECDASKDFKMQYIEAEPNDIKIIQSPVGMPGRAIQSEFLDKVSKGERKPKCCPVNCIRTCDVEKTPYCIISSLVNAYKGNFKNGYAFAGSNAWRAQKIESVKDVFKSLLSEYKYLI